MTITESTSELLAVLRTAIRSTAAGCKRFLKKTFAVNETIQNVAFGLLAMAILGATSHTTSASVSVSDNLCTTNHCWTVTNQDETVLWVGITLNTTYIDVPVDSGSDSVIDGWERVSIYLEYDGQEYLISNHDGAAFQMDQAPSNLDKFNLAMQSGSIRVKAGPNFTLTELFTRYQGARVRLGFAAYQGYSVDDVNLEFNQVTVKRPIDGTGNRDEGFCAELFAGDIVDLNEGQGFSVVTENPITLPDNNLLYGQGFFGRALFCANTPLLTATAPIWVIDGRGGKRFMGNVELSIVEERVSGGAVNYSNKTSNTADDAFKFDAPTRPYAVYHYALDAEPFTYPYELNGDQYSVSDRGGWAGMTFSVEFNDQMQLFASPFDTEALNSAWQSGGGSTVMATEATGNRDTRKFRVSGGVKEAQIAIFTNFGLSAEDVVQTGHLLRVTRPTVGSAPWGDGADCAFPTLEGFSPQIEREKQIGLYFSDLIEGGSAPMFEHSLGENALLNCSDTPPGIYDLQVAALDGRGGKKLFDLTVEVLAEQTPGGKLEWVGDPTTEFLECNDYCIQTEDRLMYRFALRPEAEVFPFFHNMAGVSAEFAGGWVGGAFEFKLDGEFVAFNTTDINGDYQTNDYFAERSASFTTAIRDGGGGVSLRTSSGVDNSFRLNDLEKPTSLGLTTDNGFLTDQVSVLNRYVRLTRLEVGSGSRAEEQCTEYPIDGYANGISHHGQGSLVPNNLITGGTMDLLGFGGENSFYLCSDTPVGIYPVTFQIIDGRGGKVQTELVIEVLEERVAGGKVEWFPNKPVSEDDADDDGVSDDADAFPNDPAASVDTDGDGKPDNWNDGKSASDSTSDPALVLDDDDDNDGIKDHLDEFPLIASTDPLDRLIDPDGDYDGDGVPNASDHFPQDPSESMDLDFDGLGNNADDDDDGDGVLDEDDAFRFNPFETVDSDGDGVGDFVDAEPNNGDVTSLVISEALAGIIDTNLRACLADRTQGLAYAGELTELVCGYDLGESIEVYDLTGLRAFHQLTYIELKRGAPTSLEPIHGLYKLQGLRLNNLAWDFHDFDQLAPFYSLTEFGSDSFQNVQPVELEILGRLPRLTNLSVGSNSSLKTLSFVSKIPRLRQLWISYSEIEDYSQLESLYYLKTLWLDFKAGPKFSDLSFLTFSPNLKELGLGGANLEGLAGIEQARNLEDLSAGEGPISDIAVLADLAHLKNLNLFQQRISDITPLARLQQLETVNLAENNLSSLGTVLINWGYPTSFNLSNNPLPCSEIEAARTNANLTIQFDGDCLKISEDADADNDGISDESDAFPNDPAASVDTDGDGKPDDWNEGKSAADSTSNPALVLDDDDDNDGVKDINDDYPRDPTRTIFDIDSDGVRDALDNCPNIANADQLDLDGDGDGDLCDTNRDGDSCPDADDAYPSDPARCEKGLQKAIVVAGGGPYRENFLWEATERMAELAITTLRGQGIPREQILYLSAGFGKNDVPDGPATIASIEAGIIDWAGDVDEPADDVLLYLVDHGGPETFELAKKTLLSASELDGWLDTLQANTASKLVVVYDACQSGSFIPTLTATGDQERMLMMSSGADERAHFAAKGDISFSFHFWSNFLVGGDLYRSFVAGNNAIEAVFDRRQNAELEVDGGGQANSKQDKVLATAFSFGSGIALASDTPEIGRVSEDIVLNGETKVRIEARDVSGASPIVRVWALVQSPDQIELAIDEPLINTEILELTDADGDGNWEGVYQDAKIRGAYEFQLFAANEANQYSAPKLDQSNRVLVTQKVGRTPLIGRDSDQDGVLDIADAFPLDPLHQLDLDGDMLPDGLDPDADGDGVRDAYNGPDRFEGFDTVAHSAITIADLAAVKRAFHADNDEDYLAFFGIGDETVTVRVTPTADQISGPDLIVSILDDTGAVYIQDGKKLTADNELQGDAEDLRFTPTESGRYLVQVSQARLAGATSFVTGAQSEYEISITSDGRSVASTDLAISLNKQRYQAQESAWEQRLAASGVSDNDGLTKSYLMLPGAITPVGFDEAQCEFSRRVLTCTLDQAGDLARPVQLVAADEGVFDLALTTLQFNADGEPLVDTNLLNNLDIARIHVSEDADVDGLPDEYERIRGLDARIDDSADDFNGDGVSNYEEYLRGASPITANQDQDGDGVTDSEDAFPDDYYESADFDGDGTGDNADEDDDGDGINDLAELADGTDPFDRFSCLTGCFSFDVDQSLDASPLTDGLLVIRFLFGFEGEALTNGAVGTAAERADAESVASYLGSARQALDIDGDGEAKALTDGLLLIRYLFGFEGDALISGAIGRDATRKDAASVEAYIEARLAVGA
ncbi:hypothetical protein OAW16_01775 [Pseudomonadales bacterium]|nr:hypothetical protein [Pseudomonadales bacterium]